MSTLDDSNLYRVIRTHCNCHPETCCCSNYQIVLNNKPISNGGDRTALEALIDLANSAILPDKKE